MNIFYLDTDPKVAAMYHCDKHVGKMTVESLQMMSVALATHGLERPLKADGMPYSAKAYKNHPCTKWVAESQANFMWLHKLTAALCDEFESRFGKKHAGKSSLRSIFGPTNPAQEAEYRFLHALGKPLPKAEAFIDNFSQWGVLPPPLCMPDEYKPKIWKDCKAVQGSYRAFYRGEKANFAKWDHVPNKQELIAKHSFKMLDGKFVPVWW